MRGQSPLCRTRIPRGWGANLFRSLESPKRPINSHLEYAEWNCWESSTCPISFSFCASMFQFHLCCDPQLPFSIYPTLLTSANGENLVSSRFLAGGMTLVVAGLVGDSTRLWAQGPDHCDVFQKKGNSSWTGPGHGWDAPSPATSWSRGRNWLWKTNRRCERFGNRGSRIPQILGREEGPRSFPTSLVPAVPGQEISQVTPATPASQVRTEVRTPAQTPGARDESSGAVAVQHEAVVPVVTEVIATDSKMIENGGSADLPRALDVPGQRQPVPMPMMTPGTQSGASPPQQPLFDDQQLRRFQELFQQAPWLYPGGPVAFHQPAIQPPISRPLFLEQDERRMQETVGMGSQYVYPYGPAVGVRENLELKKGIEEVLEENRKLREKVERLEKAQLSQSEEDPKFSTPTGDNPKEAETPNQEADRPPKGSQSYHRSQQEAETPYQEADRPPKGRQHVRQVSKEAETPYQEAERPPKPESRQNSKPEEYKEANRPPKNGSDEEPTTVKVMLKLMEGMQAIQRQMLEHRDEETGTESVRQAPALPALSEWSATTGPIDLNDWMALIEPMMCDLSNSSAQWWQQLVMEANLWYQRHLQLPPLDRVAHVPAPSTELAKPKWARLERRASTLLLMAVPEGQREELISAKRLSAMAIICQLLVTYQPGGLAEKELILRSLELPPESSNLVEAVQSLRRWARWRRRAADLQISEPDPFLLLKGLNRIIRKPLENNRGLSFRISLARSTLQVDSTPTSTSVTSFALHLVAEFEQVVHQETSNASKKRVEPEKANWRS